MAGRKVTSDVGPFAIVPEWLADAVSPSALTLFVRLALHADRDTDQAWPSRARLAKLMDVSTKSIDRWLAELVDAGAIHKTPRRDQGGWHSSLYLVKYVSPPRAKESPTPSPTDVSQNQNQLEPEPRTRETLAPRKRDAIWDCLVDLYGEPTGSGRGARNAAVKVLRDYGADPDVIRAFVTVMAGTDRDWAVTTPSALAKHFGERDALTAQVLNPRKRRVSQADELMRQAMEG